MIEPCEMNERQAKIVAYQNQLPPCPFCGNNKAILMTSQNKKTGIYRAEVQCGDYHCCGNIGYNDRDRDKAELTCIEKWSKRTTVNTVKEINNGN